MKSLNEDSLWQNKKKKKKLFVYTFDKGLVELGDIPRVYLSGFQQCNKIVSKSFIIEIAGWFRCIKQ